MKRLNVFATEDEIKYIKECANAPVMFLSGGRPMHEDPTRAATDLPGGGEWTLTLD